MMRIGNNIHALEFAGRNHIAFDRQTVLIDQTIRVVEVVGNDAILDLESDLQPWGSSPIWGIRSKNQLAKFFRDVSGFDFSPDRFRGMNQGVTICDRPAGQGVAIRCVSLSATWLAGCAKDGVGPAPTILAPPDRFLGFDPSDFHEFLAGRLRLPLADSESRCESTML